jgi:hypothetical protein
MQNMKVLWLNINASRADELSDSMICNTSERVSNLSLDIHHTWPTPSNRPGLGRAQ